jgi:hypothetical protein
MLVNITSKKPIHASKPTHASDEKINKRYSIKQETYTC